MIGVVTGLVGDQQANSNLKFPLSIGKMVEGGLFNRYQNRGLQGHPVSNLKSSRFKG